MARIDSLLAIVVDQGANELRIGSDREPKMFAQGTAKKLHLPAMPEQTIRDLLGEIITPEREALLAARKPAEATHETAALGNFHVTMTAREGGGLDVIFLRGGKRGAGALPVVSPPPAPPPPSAHAHADGGTTPVTHVPAPTALGVASHVTVAAPSQPRPIVVGVGRELALLIARAASMNASDLHLLDGEIPVVRVGGVLSPLDDQSVVNLAEALTWEGDAHARISRGESADNAADVEDSARVRLHVYATSAGLAAAVRLLPRLPPILSSLQLPVPLDDLAFAPHGLVLVCGATGSGKSTTLAALAQEALKKRSIVMVTLEDPIEFSLAASSQSLVRRRLVGRDTPDFASGLRDALREDPDVLALTAAETGHLVLASIHSRSAASAIERIVDSYAAERQAQIRVQLADSLRAIVVQRLLPRATGMAATAAAPSGDPYRRGRAEQPRGRIVAMEVLRGTHAVGSLIREGKTAQIATLIQSGKKDGMLSLERCLADQVKTGEIRVEDARAAANDVGSLQMYLAK